MASNTKDKIFFPGTNKPIAIFFAIVPTLTILVSAFCIYNYKLPLILVAMLLVLIASCGMLAKEALSQLGDVTVELSAQDLTVRKLIGGGTYPWSDIEAVKLINPGATFAAQPNDDEKSSAIGLFLRKPDRKEAPADDMPDVMIVARAGEDVAAVTKAFDRISAIKRGGVSPTPGRKGGIGSAKGFRRPAAA